MRSKLFKSLYVQVICAILLGIAFGHFFPSEGAALKPLGDAFVKLVKMMITPVVFCTIVLGITSMPNSKEIGKTLLKAMLLFYALTLIALATGLVAVYALHPGVGMNVDPAHLDTSVAAKFLKPGASKSFVDFLLQIIPVSFFGAFSEGEVLPVLLVAILTGFGLNRVGVNGEPVRKAIDSFSHVIFAAFSMMMKLAPLGAFGAMAFTVGKYGVQSLGSLGMLIATFYAACLFFVLVVLGALARIHGFSILKMMRYIREELLIVLATSSSEPALPRMLQKLEKLGCKKGVVGLVLPTGYSFNLDGTAIYLTLASVFIAQACNIHLSLGQVLTMLFVMLLTSKGAAGVTGSGFVALVATLSIMPEIPVAGVALIVGIDRFMSEARALTSLVSNAVAVVVVSKWENACDNTVLQAELNRGYVTGVELLSTDDTHTVIDANPVTSNKANTA